MRPLAPEERALWEKVIESVRPIRPQAKATAEAIEPAQGAAAPKPVARAAPLPRPQPRPAATPGVTLDGSWDRKLSRGLVQPDLSVDLHGHNLATAYDLLDRRLEGAIASGARVMLLVTGKPPQGAPLVARGRIRAAVGDWLAASRHAASIAAVRGAHPRHGGSGALYIILRKARGR